MIFDIDDAFEDFMRKANPTVSPTSTQYSESRRVFCAGMTALFLFMQGPALRAMTDDEAEAELKDIDRQLVEFFKKRIGFSD